MIIYQGSVGRLFPLIAKRILENVNPSLECHFPFILNNEKDWFDSNNILRAIPKKAKHIRTNGFLYGVFGNSHLNINSDDFIFTILNHPVDQVYECFAYIKHITNDLSENFNSLKRSQSIALKQFSDVTIEQFVDLVLYDFDLSFDYLGISYSPIKENIYGFDSYDHFNYVGRYDNLDPIFEKISEVFGKTIQPIEERKHLSYTGNYYKRDLLEEKFKEKIDFFNQLT
jgi:hypothetical protein